MADATTLSRREFLKRSAYAAGAAALWSSGCISWPWTQSSHATGTLVNDIHSQLNPTRVRRIIPVDSIEAVQNALLLAKHDKLPVSVGGARHAGGGQQFAADGLLLDMTPMRRMLTLDAEAGIVEIESGASWPTLMHELEFAQTGRTRPWGILQKQSGADELTIGGALGSNIHSRALTMRPIIADVDAFTMVDAEGAVRRCSRAQNGELFRLAIGGYGLFGVITSVRLRLGPRKKMQRKVTLLEVDDVMTAFDVRISEGYTYGDFQYAIDPESDGFLRRGILSCYRPIGDDEPMPERKVELSREQWQELLYLAHAHPGRAFERYTAHYLATDGQRYWSDLHQLGPYVNDYHRWVDGKLGDAVHATEALTELYVPRPALAAFLDNVRDDFRKHRVPLIYGTIRLIEKDEESFLAWAKQPYVCVIFNLHTVHTPAGIERSANDFRRLIDMAIRHGGSYYLTYHRFATKEQALHCYPQFPEFLRLKRRYDPQERFQSDWYRHYSTLLS